MEEEEQGIDVVWKDIFCALEEEQGVVRDIDIVLLAIVPTYSLTLESSTQDIPLVVGR